MSGPVDQAKNAETFLADTVHEERLDKLLWAMRLRRDAAARQVPEWEELRTLASEIKEHTLSNLSDYLIQFETKATANGVTVHWARDAHEHNQIVYDLLAAQGTTLLVKSKSMLTEECELRPFLERRNIASPRPTSVSASSNWTINRRGTSSVLRFTRRTMMWLSCLRKSMDRIQKMKTPLTSQA